MSAERSAQPASAFVEPVTTERTFEQAISHVVDGIERNRLREGDRLPNESELAEQLAISKPTLRQALRVLERAGLIAVKRGAGGGIFLATDLIPFDLINSYVASEEHQVVEVLVARRVVETGVARLAALAATEEDLDEIQRTIDLLERHRGNRALVMRADAAFHRAVSRACHNRALQAAMRSLGNDIAPIRDAYRGGAEEDELTLDVHRRQLHVMRLRDADALAPILDEHFRMLENAFAEAIGSSWDALFGAVVAAPPAADR
ncbi:FadR/GntR family transcriptional regulator [Conexibacter woesei]|uniref:GntR domain protein n=1 Tax=Conexibacter woesei (strain DSM 14684 / CCUG 47730 / CIP 108061 / JCM 11494 / NBRC 100937 / ID131577) TaxID=469383 RepID=D3F5G1_CONWI|nr:FCD domain-containing protein [Conexibacter woesei]ADB50628.1 GntR domain protein [Conexibacter woesei DSM 14684]